MQADGMVPKLKAFKLINNERGISLTTEGIARLKGPRGSCSPPRCPSTEGEVVRTDPNISLPERRMEPKHLPQNGRN